MHRLLARKKDKKKQQAPKPQLDLSTALPNANDFRTSLIMPGLSTRFSMLREQDDPTSKIGKASDDSVLQPKRQSRLHEFGFVPGGLFDIAEVKSLSDSVRPAFAADRQDSFHSESTEAGSIMTRARPGEGNVLFGGRQKVYKISNTGSSGRLLYDDDVHLSAFQRLRHQEREQRAQQNLEHANILPPSESASPSQDTYSSMEDFTRPRHTSSSSNSGSIARVSTAATSIASQGASSIATAPTSPTEGPRSTKARRLYEQGLEQQMQDQQSSAIDRLNSIQRTRAPTGRATPPLLHPPAKSATNLNDRFHRGVPGRTESPILPVHPAISKNETRSNESSPALSRAQSPPLLRPLASDGDEVKPLNIALQHQDRGKATATGAFSKPKHAFSEEQYAERLKRLQREYDVTTPKLESPRKPTLRERAESEKRRRAEALALERQQSNSSDDQKQTSSPFSVFQSAANEMKNSLAAPALPPKQPRSSPFSINPPARVVSPAGVQSPNSRIGKTSSASPGISDGETESAQPNVPKPSDRGRRLEHLPTATGPAPPILEHPALRSRSNSQLAETFDHPALRSRSNSRLTEPSGHSPLRSRSNSRAVQPEAQYSPNITAKTMPDGIDRDSATLGLNNGGLSGLIRQHLRSISDVSSDYGDHHQNMIDASPPQTQPPTSGTDMLAESNYSHSNVLDLNNMETNPFANERTSVSSDTSKSNMQSSIVPKPLTDDASQWKKEEEKTHQRGRSVEEHEAFQRDLAQRQRAIQQSLRARAEGRSTSPVPPPSSSLKSALNLLRAKSSHESFPASEHRKQPEAGSRALKKLGLGASLNSSSTSLISEQWRGDGLSIRQKSPRLLQQDETEVQRRTRKRSGTDDSAHDTRPKGISPPTSSNSSTRNRSSSELSSSRSRSRTRRYRDDLDQAMAEGVGSRSTTYLPNPSPSFSGYASNPTPPLPTESPPFEGPAKLRLRITSKSMHVQPIHTESVPMNGTNSHLPPSGAFSHVKPTHFSPGLPVSPRQSPGGASPSFHAFRPKVSPVPPFSAHTSPPVSNPGTPIPPTFNHSAASPPMAKAGALRKKSIAKCEISDPVFISTTSVIDTVNLPPGASLRNGVDPTPPPVPLINPRRKFGSGQREVRNPAIHPGLGASYGPFAEPMSPNSADTLTKQRLRKMPSESKSLHTLSHGHGEMSPGLAADGFGRIHSPPLPINQHHFTQANMNGAMF